MASLAEIQQKLNKHHELETAILDLTVLVKSEFPDTVHGSLKLLGTRSMGFGRFFYLFFCFFLALLYLDADNIMRAQIVRSLEKIDIGFPVNDDLLDPVLRVVRRREKRKKEKKKEKKELILFPL
jgi:hypothetical protein